MDLIGWGLLIGGFASISPSIDYCEDETWDAKKCDEQGVSTDLYITTSIIILAASRITSWIFPFIYQKKQNRALKEALNIKVSYSIDPLLIPKDGMPAVGLAFNLRY